MKKVGQIIIAIFVVFFVSGCTNNTEVLTCSGLSKGNNMNADGKVEYYFKNDKLYKANIETVFKDINITNLSSFWSTYKEQFTEQNKPVDEDGFKRTITFDDDNYTFTVNIEIDYDKITKDIMDKYSVSDYSSKNYQELKKETTADGVFSCK